MPDKLRNGMRHFKHRSHDHLCDRRDTLLGRIILERPIFYSLQLLANLHTGSIDMRRRNFDSLDHHNDELG